MSRSPRPAFWPTLLAALALLAPMTALGKSVAADADTPSFGGGGCHVDDSRHLCLGVKLVTYRDGNGSPILGEDDAQAAMDRVNSVWKQCDLSFQIDKYVPVDPGDYGLKLRTANYSELTEIRNAFQEANMLLLVFTGTWERKGSLGGSTANAWTTMPGSGPYGSVLERPVSHNSNIMAHELGHYLNLFHVADELDVMNAIIYGRSTAINEGQCATARLAAKQYWSKMLR